MLINFVVRLEFGSIMMRSGILSISNYMYAGILAWDSVERAELPRCVRAEAWSFGGFYLTRGNVPDFNRGAVYL